MNVKIAADKCKPFIAGCTNLPDHHPEYGKDHLFEMLDKIHAMDSPNDDEKRTRLKELLAAEIFGDLPHYEPSVDAAVEKIIALMKPCEKSMRWIGWLQACIVMGGGATLEQMKRINAES